MEDQTNEVATPGGRIGARIARIVSDTIVWTRQRLAKTQSDVAKEVFTSVTNEVSDEVRAAVGPLYAKLADHAGVSPELQPLLSHLARTRGQAFGWMGGAIAHQGLSAGLGDLFSWLLSPTVQAIIASEPVGLLGNDQLASLVARGLLDPQRARDTAAANNLGPEGFDLLTRLVQGDLNPANVIDLFNRGILTEDEAVAELLKGGYSRESAVKFLTLAKVPLSPQDAAQAWARSLVSPELVHMAARAAGLTNADGDVLMGLAGEPPATQDILLAWRRGIITEADVDRAIVQGPIRNEWIPAVKALFEEPLPVTEAASAVTQGHLTEEQGRAKAALSGISAEDFAVMVDNSGIPPGLEFAAEAFNRGLITDEQYVAMFLESRIKNKYVPLMRAMRENLPPADTARMAYRLGVAPREWAVNVLAGHGFSRENAEVMLNLEDARHHESTKDLSRSQVLELFEDGIIDEDMTKGLLGQAGFDDIEVGWMVALAQVRVSRRFVNALTTRVRAAYVAGNLDAEHAASTLDQAGVAGAQRDQLLAIWDLEREVLSRQLTPAQIVSAVKKGFLDRGEGKDRLVAQGYTEGDAEILIRLSVGA
jgi:hypothetical protein